MYTQRNIKRLYKSRAQLFVIVDLGISQMTIYFQSIVISLIITEETKTLCRIIYKQIQLSQNS